MKLRKADDRGRADHGWLDTRHSFSFADYFDREHMGFRALRVINDDRVGPGAGFPRHGHRNMEIISYVIDGALEHRDSMGETAVIARGDVQRMSAGTGVVHSEYNHSTIEGLRFLQIWLLPERQGIAPSYDQRHFAAEEKQGRLCLIASHDGRRNSLGINQDASIYAGLLSAKDAVVHEIASSRHVWIQIARGEATVSTDAGSEALRSGDGVAISGVDRVELRGTADEPAELLVFDLA